MLQFFRKAHKALFLFFLILISLTFIVFAGYQGVVSIPQKVPEEILFRTKDGRKISRSYFQQMADFLNEESWMTSSAIPWDMNFLNHDFISTNILAGEGFQPILDRYETFIRNDLDATIKREQQFQPYQHPNLPFLSANLIWQQLAPEIPESLSIWQKAQDPIASFNKKRQLFLAEKQFPPAILTRILKYQEREHGGSTPKDSRLDQKNISLFNYHSIADWFGKSFVNKIVELVIHTAALAREKGYRVSQEELSSQIHLQTYQTYQALLNNPETCDTEHVNKFFQLFLRQKGWTESSLLAMYEDLSLFQRIMQDIDFTALADTLSLEKFHAYANQQVVLEVYQMSPEFRFQTEEEKKQFAAYIAALSPDPSLHSLPIHIRSIEEIRKQSPPLIGKHYQLTVASLNKQHLQTHITMKETQAWKQAHADLLTAKFSDQENSGDQDFYANMCIIDEHPEWIQEALEKIKPTNLQLVISPGSQSIPLAGVCNISEFQTLIDHANTIDCFSQDQQNFHKIVVCSRSENDEILPFKEARQFCDTTHDLPTISFEDYLSTHAQQILEEPEKPLLWDIEKSEVTISRNNPSFLSFEDVLQVAEEGGTSPVRSDPKEGPYFFHIKELATKSSEIPIDKQIAIQQLISQELRPLFYAKIMNQAMQE